jgi:aldose 1-epimerase
LNPPSRTSSAQLVELGAGELRVALAPDVGGAIAAFSRHWREHGQERSLQWLRPATPAALADRNPLAMASFPLLPFCNRIRAGRASFEGREIRFPPNHPSAVSPHPLHGIGWQLPWTVLSANGREAELSLDVDASEAWPWRFSARQRFSLDDSGLAVEIALTNDDSAAMPAGIGHHPYFPHTPGTRLTAATSAMWLGDAEVMPTTLEPAEAVEKLRSGVVLSELDLDNNFVGWQREALVEWPADAQGPERSLTLRAEPPLDYFVLYCPRGEDHFCAEPVSQCTDWINLLPTYGRASLGGTRLAPGDTLQARFTLAPRWR